MNSLITSIIAIIMAIVSTILGVIGNGNTPDNPSEEPPTTDIVSPSYKTFDKEIGNYVHDDVYSEFYNNYKAWMQVYLMGETEQNLTNFKNEFKKVYGFIPEFEIEVSFIGTYIVEGYDEPCHIYNYEIYDYTYPLLTDEFHTVYRKVCDDGSPWTGFCILGSIEDWEVDPLVPDLIDEMHQEFMEWTGYPAAYIDEHKENFTTVGLIESTQRTKDGKITKVTYCFCRGYNIPLYYEG